MRAEPLLITLGDANGLGPELACRLLSGPLPDRLPTYLADRALLLLGAEASLRAHLSFAGGTSFWTRVDDPARALTADAAPGVYLYEPPGLGDIRVQVGQATPDGGRAAGVALATACDLLLAPVSGDGPYPPSRSAGPPLSVGLVTLPLHKAMLHAAGYDVPGHTEYLARRAGLGDDEVCMHLGGDVLRVSLVTTHPPLREVPGLITRQRVLHCLRLTAAHARAIRADGPVAVCGLNPHAGESGRIGREEIDIIAPAVADAVAEGLHVIGPLPADTLFVKAARGAYAAVLAMYHDQGLAPLKMLHFSDAVNVTLGLPFVRTSVDHGTGFDIAGTGTADTGSFAAALRLACTLCDRKD